MAALHRMGEKKGADGWVGGEECQLVLSVISFHFIYFIYLFINPHQDGTIKT